MVRFLIFFGFFLLPTLAQAELRIVTTMPEFAAVAQELGGEGVSVTSLTSATQDAHFIDAKPSFVLKLNQADLLIVNGLELEIGWIPTLITQARNPKVQPGQSGYLDASTLAAPILEVPQGTIDRSMGDIHPGGNPHFSRDPKRMLNIIEGIAKRIISLQPESKTTVETNLSTVKTRVQEILAQHQKRWALLAPEQKQIVEYHKSWSYLFETLGVSVPIRLEPKPGVAPSPSHIAKVVKTMRSTKVTTLLQEIYLPERIMKTVAKMTKSTHLKVASGPDFKNGQTYSEYLAALLDTLYSALSKE